LEDLKKQRLLLTQETEKKLLNLNQTLNLKQQELSDKEAESQEEWKKLNAEPSHEEVTKKWKQVGQEIIDLKIEIGLYGETQEKLEKLSSLEKEKKELQEMYLQGEEARKKPFLDKLYLLEIKSSVLRIQINDLEILQTNLISNSTSNLEEIDLQISDFVEKQISEEKASILKKPEDWVFFIGVPFGISAIVAISISIFEPNQIKSHKGVKFLLLVSLGSMTAGFIYLIVIFLKIGNVL